MGFECFTLDEEMGIVPLTLSSFYAKANALSVCLRHRYDNSPFLLIVFSGEKSPSGSPREQCPPGNLRTVRVVIVVSFMFADSTNLQLIHILFLGLRSILQNTGFILEKD